MKGNTGLCMRQCIKLYVVLSPLMVRGPSQKFVQTPVIAEGFTDHVFLTLTVPKNRSDAKTLTSAWQLMKNWPQHLFCIWGPIMCELKGKTPQEGINRRQSGDRVKHGGQMVWREPSHISVYGRVSCCCCSNECGSGSRMKMGQPWIPD